MGINRRQATDFAGFQPEPDPQGLSGLAETPKDPRPRDRGASKRLRGRPAPDRDHHPMSDIETRLTAIFFQQGDYVDLRALRDIVAPSDVRDAAKLIEPKKLKDARTHLESNGLVAVRESSTGKFEVHVDLALEYVLYRKKELKTFVASIRNIRPGGIRNILDSTPGLFERVQIVFGDTGKSVLMRRL